MGKEQCSETIKAGQNWQEVTNKKIEEAIKRGVPLRFIDILRDSKKGYYITIDQRKDPYTILFFHTNLVFNGAKWLDSAVVLEKSYQPKLLLLSDCNKTEKTWVILPSNSSTLSILDQQLNSLKRSRVFDPKVGTWEGRYPDIDKIVEAL